MSNGWKRFDDAITRIENAMSNPKFVEEAGNYALSAAKLMCSGFKVTSGELRSSLQMTVTQGVSGICAHVGTNKAYAAFVEFGTGPKGQAHHAGTAPDAGIVYSLTPWWIHESQVDKTAAAVYKWSYIDTKEGRFYRCTGQPAHPYLYPAFEDNKDAIANILAKGLQEAAKE